MTGTNHVTTEDTSDSPSTSTESKRYNLRLCSQVNRVLVERRKEEPRKRKPKCKPPPLSKYRRKTANSRERTRMNEINQAFEELRNVIPEYPPGKMTKITTLRLALNYLSELRELLGYPPCDFPSSSSTDSGSSSESSSASELSSPSESSSVSDCATSPEHSSTSPTSELQSPFSELADTDSDTSLNQLFELNLDSSLQDAPLDTSMDTSLDDFSVNDLPSWRVLIKEKLGILIPAFAWLISKTVFVFRSLFYISAWEQLTLRLEIR